LLYLSFVLRITANLGINDVVFLVFTDLTIGPFLYALSLMAMLSLLAKITPHHVEATMFAFLAGTNNLTGLISGLEGSFIAS